ncbi:MAG TPA: MoaD/ThiS family protein [Opitutaceae bacterium]|nr:MoaD/ThiS family protein [Opitutaceae bacterium]
MKRVHVQYFALLREQARRAEEAVETAADTPAALYRELAARHGFTLPAERARVALGGEFAAWDAPLRDGARLAFIPPFAGG